MSLSASSVSFKEAVLTFLFILLMATVARSNLVPPVVPASAPVTDFSAERAMKYLTVIAREPHPIGSIANGRVRGYIVEQIQSLGLNPELQKSVSTTSWDIGGAPYTRRNRGKCYWEIAGNKRHGRTSSCGALRLGGDRARRQR
jgi:hypothetical protein